jgi:RNA polymerase sigma-70 factor, ECF subfamily
MSKLQEEQLVKRILERDEQALHALFHQYHKPLLAFISRQLTDKQLAEELVQDVFMDFLEALRDFRYQSSVKTFLFTIARNKVIDVIRKKKIKRILFSALPAFVVEGLARVVMDDDIEKKELEEKMQKVFSTLPHDYQVILRLKYMEDESVRKISEELALPFKATESLLFRARKAFVKVFNGLP